MFKVTFTYINKDGFIRQGAIVVSAKNADAAKEAATAALAKHSQYNSPRIVTAKPY